MREKELLIERLEQDRRHFADCEMGNVKRRNGIRPRYRHLHTPRTQGTNSSDDTPLSVPISVTQTLTNLRLTHADLLEEHGATTASLRQRFAEFLSFANRFEDDARGEGGRVPPGSVGELQSGGGVGRQRDTRGGRDGGTGGVTCENMNALEALEGPLVSIEELEKVKQEKKALHQTIPEHEQEIIAQATKIDELEQALADLSGEDGRRPTRPAKNPYLVFRGNHEALIKQLKQLEEKWVSSSTASQTGRQAGSAIDAEAERDPIALVVNIVPPFLDDARLDGCEYTRQRGVHAALHYITKSQSTNQSLLWHVSTALDLYIIESKVEGRWFEVKPLRAFFDPDCSVCPNSGLTNVGGPRCINGFAEAMALSPSRPTADMPFIDKWIGWIRRSFVCRVTQTTRQVFDSRSPWIELTALQWNSYHAAIDGSNLRPGFEESSMETIAYPTTTKARQVRHGALEPGMILNSEFTPTHAEHRSTSVPKIKTASVGTVIQLRTWHSAALDDREPPEEPHRLIRSEPGGGRLGPFDLSMTWGRHKSIMTFTSCHIGWAHSGRRKCSARVMEEGYSYLTNDFADNLLRTERLSPS
ncbi:hypothetical protein BKA70DRAFT_1570606 [Coprinopsis sp. MPI-PUGE-AT-0042]|nr:hypothetical protein BKA70DRAFT_1570606 [Coprinopsis sp. MPI-PUGE-AT-0042]